MSECRYLIGDTRDIGRRTEGGAVSQFVETEAVKAALLNLGVTKYMASRATTTLARSRAGTYDLERGTVIDLETAATLTDEDILSIHNAGSAVLGAVRQLFPRSHPVRFEAYISSWRWGVSGELEEPPVLHFVGRRPTHKEMVGMHGRKVVVTIELAEADTELKGAL